MPVPGFAFTSDEVVKTTFSSREAVCKLRYVRQQGQDIELDVQIVTCLVFE
jgi:hypothetical protein